MLKTPSPVKLLLHSQFGGADRLENYLKNVGGDMELMILGTIRHRLLMSAMNAPQRRPNVPHRQSAYGDEPDEGFQTG